MARATIVLIKRMLHGPGTILISIYRKTGREDVLMPIRAATFRSFTCTKRTSH